MLFTSIGLRSRARSQPPNFPGTTVPVSALPAVISRLCSLGHRHWSLCRYIAARHPSAIPSAPSTYTDQQHWPGQTLRALFLGQSENCVPQIIFSLYHDSRKKQRGAGKHRQRVNASPSPFPPHPCTPPLRLCRVLQDDEACGCVNGLPRERRAQAHLSSR